MSRLYKKCFAASSCLHVLLALVLVVCPAFVSSKSKTSEVQPITFFPDILIDEPFSNPGGSPGRLPPAPAPPAPAPAPPVAPPAPAPRPQPAPQPKEEVVPPKAEGESLEVSKEPTRKKPQISLVPVVRKSNTKAASKDTASDDNRERQWLEARQQLANQVGRAASNIRSGTGAATAVEEGFGSGSGPSYASYTSWVWSYFDRAWVRPQDASMEDATVVARVTIARDGTVIAKRIIKPSSDAAVDASVQRTLDRVNSVERPFPEGSKDKERTYNIPFNMKSKRGTA